MLHRPSQTRYSSIGALDLGGASTQIAFETNDTVQSEFSKTEKLFGVTYNLYARSYLCYGENQAYARFLAYLIHKVHYLQDLVPNKQWISEGNLYLLCVYYLCIIVYSLCTFSGLVSFLFLWVALNSQCRHSGAYPVTLQHSLTVLVTISISSQNESKAVNVSNPCLFNGTKVSIKSSTIYTTCVNHAVATQVFGHQLTPPPSLPESVGFVGTGNSTQCKQFISDAFNGSKNFVTPPPVSGHFVVSGWLCVCVCVLWKMLA